ncbi:hypothetical protein EB796_004870 [Bugula neritina]|uniref:Fibronectin type-III domain-containing protein n=1 Tax=Bugula neritina TaxID=10212 RepID=A0A7J7KDT7_BUGNE|nr:hypothetical protein EB796_004870 [Bugula neritina]
MPPVVVTSKQTAAKVTDLLPGEHYVFRVTALSNSKMIASVESQPLIVDTSPVTNITAALLPEQNSTSVRVTWDYISIPTLGSDIEILCEPECLGTWVMDRARTEIVLILPKENLPASVSNVTSILSPNYYTSGALVSWTNPPFYTKWDYPNGIGTTKLTADASNFTVNSLQPGFTYIFTLQAVVGDGQMRVTSNAATFTANTFVIDGNMTSQEYMVRSDNVKLVVCVLRAVVKSTGGKVMYSTGTTVKVPLPQLESRQRSGSGYTDLHIYETIDISSEGFVDTTTTDEEGARVPPFIGTSEMNQVVRTDMDSNSCCSYSKKFTKASQPHHTDESLINKQIKTEHSKPLDTFSKCLFIESGTNSRANYITHQVLDGDGAGFKPQPSEKNRSQNKLLTYIGADQITLQSDRQLPPPFTFESNAAIVDKQVTPILDVDNKLGYVTLSDLTGYEPLVTRDVDNTPYAVIDAETEQVGRANSEDSTNTDNQVEPKPGYVTLSDLTGYEVMTEVKEVVAVCIQC